MPWGEYTMGHGGGGSWHFKEGDQGRGTFAQSHEGDEGASLAELSQVSQGQGVASAKALRQEGPEAGGSPVPSPDVLVGLCLPWLLLQTEIQNQGIARLAPSGGSRKGLPLGSSTRLVPASTHTAPQLLSTGPVWLSPQRPPTAFSPGPSPLEVLDPTHKTWLK